MEKHQPEYDTTAIRFLELLWGEGFLSPGGTAEVDAVLSGLQLSGKRVLDFGCGAGGIACFLVEAHDAAHVTGFDVEIPVIETARRRAESRGLGERLDFVCGEAERSLPFADQSFDVVFSKDAIVHVRNKGCLFAEVWRVLRPGGIFAASDWMIGHDGKPSKDMLAYLAAEDLSFNMASPIRYRRLLEETGFQQVETQSRNEWYLKLARCELKKLNGAFGKAAAGEVGRDYVDKNISTWKAMLAVLETGEHCPTHFRASKPGLQNGGTAS